jgi:dTDP-4-dehydrorhamnose 3,5-epimerase-like enzyme
MIQGVELVDLKVYEDNRGFLFEIASETHEKWIECKHIYVATARRGVAKAQHAHMLQTDRFCVIHGTAQIGLIDLRGDIGSIPKEDGGPDTWTLHGKPFVDPGWYNAMGNSPTFLEQQTIVMSGDRPQLLYIPAGVSHGQMALSEMSYLLNLPTVPFNRAAPDEVRIPADAFGYKWEIENK